MFSPGKTAFLSIFSRDPKNLIVIKSLGSRNGIIKAHIRKNNNSIIFTGKMILFNHIKNARRVRSATAADINSGAFRKAMFDTSGSSAIAIPPTIINICKGRKVLNNLDAIRNGYAVFHRSRSITANKNMRFATQPIEGVTFNILDSKKKVVKTVVTGKDGIARVDNLLKGTYYYQEVSAPDCYQYNDSKVKFKIDNNAQIVKETVTNKKITGTIIITKIDDAKQPVKDVVFEIKDANDQVVDKITTNEKGIATSSKELVKGIYTYQEVSAPDGYIMDNDIYKFEVKNVNQVIKKTVKNERVKGYLEITKVDDSKNPIKGVKFEVYDANHNKVDTITTDSKGKATTKELLIGIYTYKEVSAPAEYVMDVNEYTFEVTSKNTQIAKTVENKRAKASLRIIKLDKTTKAPIEGVTFEVLNDKKEVVDTIVTNAKGIAQSKDLALGKYYYREVSAPDKYIVDNKIKLFTLGKASETFEATVYKESKSLPVTGGSDRK